MATHVTVGVAVLLIILSGSGTAEANPFAKRLYDDLLSNYNRLIRPVSNNTEKLTVWLKLKLSQLIDVNLKSQIMTTNVWVEQKWVDYKLRWNPEDYGGVDKLYVPSEHIWLPDIVLFNNADGNYEVTLMTKATLRYDGQVVWKPPAIYKSSCEIDVEWFPFDEQSCVMKFGSWTYDGFQVDLKHMEQRPGSNIVDFGIDLKEYYMSVEWDILEIPAKRNEELYVETPYPDITFNLIMRRKTLFYTVNLIIPCVGISFLTVLVFYLPSDSGEKVTLCISILLSLTVFFLLLAEIIPPTSLAVPLLGKYLLFTMVLVTLSVGCTICVLNIGYRSPSTHRLSSRARRILLEWLPPLLLIRRPQRASPEPPLHELCEVESEAEAEMEGAGVELPPLTVRSAEHHQLCPALSAHLPSEPGPSRHQPVPDTPWSQPPSCGSPGPPWLGAASPGPSTAYVSSPGPSTLHRCPSGPSALRPGSLESVTSPDGWSVPSASRPVTSLIAQHEHLQKALQNVNTIASRINNLDAFEEVESDWRYVAMVLDRLFMWLFTVACTCGTCGILLQAPLLYDHTTPIDRIKSRVARANLSSMGDEDWQNREE